MRVATLISLFCLLLIGCGEPPVTFTEPMPVAGKTLDKFPKRYRGAYVNQNDGSYLYVDEYFVIRKYDYDFKIHKDSLEPGYMLAGDTILHPEYGKFTIINVEGDYLRQHISWMDTLFILTPESVLKKYKGYLFLNSLSDYSGYETQQMKLKKGVLQFNSISTPEEIEMLNEFEENDSDTIASPYSPTKREFRKFIKTEGFQNGEQFVRIK